MSEKKDIKKLNKVMLYIKSLIPSLVVMVSQAKDPALATPLSSAEKTPEKTEIKIETVPTSVTDTRLAEAKEQLDAATYVSYKGLELDLSKLKPQDVGHIFESGMNPCITDNNKPISHASYLGLCQMDFKGTLQKFVKQNAKEFPNLQRAVDKYGIRSLQFMKAWKEYSYGANAEKFEQKQFDYMWEVNYRKRFDELAATKQFPKITKENYANDENFIYTAAVMSCANQNPSKTAEIFKQARQNVGKNADINTVAFESYNIKTKRWKLKTRYKQETNLLKDKQKYIQLSQIYFNLTRPANLAQNNNQQINTLAPQVILSDYMNLNTLSANARSKLKQTTPQKNSPATTNKKEISEYTLQKMREHKYDRS